jgi:hypothetical protein
MLIWSPKKHDHKENNSVKYLPKTLKTKKVSQFSFFQKKKSYQLPLSTCVAIVPNKERPKCNIIGSKQTKMQQLTQSQE